MSEECSFCETELTSSEKLRCETEFQGWVESNQSPLILEQGTFAFDPFTVCERCRKEIQLSDEAARADEQRQKKWADMGDRLTATACIFLVAALAFAIIGGFVHLLTGLLSDML